MRFKSEELNERNYC